MNEGRGYTVRPYEPGDREGVLSLYEAVHGVRPGEEWFDWKFREAPYSSEVPMFVGTSDGGIVGIRPYLLLPTRAGPRRFRALYLMNVMVHPDHRRKGLFSRLVTRTIDHAEDQAALAITHANQNSRPIYVERGWKEVAAAVPVACRIQDPDRIVSRVRKRNGKAVRLLEDIGPLAARGYLVACDGLTDEVSRWRSGIDVHRERGVAVETLASLYGQWVPSACHVEQGETYYQWRFSSPDWECWTYIVTIDDETAIAAVVYTGVRYDGLELTYIADVVPMYRSERHWTALLRLVARVTSDHQRSTLIATSALSVPLSVLGIGGFVPDTVPPLSWVRTHPSLMARELTGIEDDSVDTSDWKLPLAVRDLFSTPWA